VPFTHLLLVIGDISDMAKKKREFMKETTSSLIFPTGPAISPADFAPLLDRKNRNAGNRKTVSDQIEWNRRKDLNTLKLNHFPQRISMIRKR
jgi:hypothetical protein